MADSEYVIVFIYNTHTHAHQPTERQLMMSWTNQYKNPQ